MNQRHLQNKSYVNVDVNLMVENVSRHKNGKRMCQFERAKPVGYCACEKDYVWNPSTCV